MSSPQTYNRFLIHHVLFGCIGSAVQSVKKITRSQGIRAVLVFEGNIPYSSITKWRKYDIDIYNTYMLHRVGKLNWDLRVLLTALCRLYRRR